MFYCLFSRQSNQTIFTLFARSKENSKITGTAWLKQYNYIYRIRKKSQENEKRWMISVRTTRNLRPEIFKVCESILSMRMLFWRRDVSPEESNCVNISSLVPLHPHLRSRPLKRPNSIFNEPRLAETSGEGVCEKTP